MAIISYQGCIEKTAQVRDHPKQPDRIARDENYDRNEHFTRALGSATEFATGPFTCAHFNQHSLTHPTFTAEYESTKPVSPIVSSGPNGLSDNQSSVSAPISDHYTVPGEEK